MRPTAAVVLTAGSKPIPTNLRAFPTRVVQVDLNPSVRFHMEEVLYQLRPSHWARVWHSGLALSRWLLEQAPLSLPVHATELGCGMGLVSMTLLHLGVVVEGTDREPTALAFAAGNARRNSLTGFTASHLDWGDPGGVPTGMVVAADVLYERETPERLFALLQTGGLLLPMGRLLVGGPHVRSGPMADLVTRLLDAGYLDVAETRAVEWDSQTQVIDIHLLTRPA